MTIIEIASTKVGEKNKDKIVIQVADGKFHEIGEISYINVFYAEHQCGNYAGTTNKGQHFMVTHGAYFPFNMLDEAKAYYDVLVKYYTSKDKPSCDQFRKDRDQYGYSLEEIKKMNLDYFGVE